MLLWTAAFLVVGYPVTFVIAMANCCKPVSFYWTQFAGNTDGHCPLNTGLFFVVMAIINLFIDFFILILPIPSILALQMSLRKKAGVCGIMLLGGLYVEFLTSRLESLPAACWSSVPHTNNSVVSAAQASYGSTI